MKTLGTNALPLEEPHHSNVCLYPLKCLTSRTHAHMSQGAVWYDVNRGCWIQNKLFLLYSTAMFKHTHAARETETQSNTTGTASASAATTEWEHT